MPEVWTHTIKTRTPSPAWAKFFLDSSGALTLISGSRSYGYHWQDWGSGDFREFLLDCHKDYLASKLKSPSFKPGIDTRQTIELVREVLIGERRCRGIGAKKARAEWELVSTFDGTDPGAWIRATKLRDPTEYLVYYKAPAHLEFVLDHIWPLFRTALQKDLAHDHSKT